MQKLKSLQKEWYKKLKNSGFQDIEKEIKGECVLKSQSTCEGKYAGIYRFMSQVEREAKEDYFRILFQKASQEQNFLDDSDKLIMERTAEGKNIREISEELIERKLHKYDRHTILYVRRRYENKWGIKKWTKQQMVSRRKKIPTL